MNDDFDVFYVSANETSKARMFDAVRYTDSGVFGFYSNQTQEELEAEHNKKLLIGKWSFVASLVENSHCTEPSPITLEDWENALEALPPEDWSRIDGVESFKFSEYYWGNVTSIYCKTNKECYVFKNRASMTAKEIADKINSLDCKVTAW